MSQSKSTIGETCGTIELYGKRIFFLIPWTRTKKWITDERLKEVESGDKKGIPWENVKKELEEKWGPFDEEGYRKQVEEERAEKERIHAEVFIGTPTMEDLIRKICSDYRENIQRDKAENH